MTSTLRPSTNPAAMPDFRQAPANGEAGASRPGYGLDRVNTPGGTAVSLSAHHPDTGHEALPVEGEAEANRWSTPPDRVDAIRVSLP